MNKFMFNITKEISYTLNEICIYLSKGKRYNTYRKLFYLIDNISTKIYTVGYNSFVLGVK